MYMTAKPMSEQAFLKTYRPDDFEHPSLAVDVVIVTVSGGRLGTVLVRRDEQPQLGRWALPGGFVGMNEGLDQAADRVLATKAGLSGIYLEQLYTFGRTNRDPRTRVVSVTYMALVDAERLVAAVAGRGDGVTLSPLHIPWEGEVGGTVDVLQSSARPFRLAFDHGEILGVAVQRLRGKVGYAPVGYELLGDAFTLRDLQLVHEAILGHSLNKDSFRKTILSRGQVESTGRREEGVAYRPAELYRIAVRTPSSNQRSK